MPRTERDNQKINATNLLGKLLESQIKEVEKQGKLQVQEAVQAGVPLDHIAKQLQVKNEQPDVGLEPLSSALAGKSQQTAQPQQENPLMSLDINKLIQSMQAQQPVQQQAPQTMQAQPAQQQIPPMPEANILQRLINALPGGNIRQAEARSAQLGNIAKEQEILGQQPLQQSEREKLNIQFVNNVLQNKGTNSLSETAAKTLTLAKNGVEQTNLLLNEFESNPNAFKSWSGPGDPRGQQIKTIRSNIADSVGRLRSGGAINKDEEKTFLNFLPKQGVISGRTENPETVVFKLKMLNKMFNDVTNGLQSGQQASAFVQKIQRAIDQGYSPSEISQHIGF